MEGRWIMAVSDVKDRFSQDSVAELELQILIRPGIDPKQRHVIEDALMEAGCEVIGGGSNVEGLESDISVCVDSVKKRLPTIMSILQDAKIGRKSIVSQRLPEEAEYSVYEGSQKWSPRIPAEKSGKAWWKFWKK